MNEEITASYFQSDQALRPGVALHIRRSKLFILLCVVGVPGFLAWEKALSPELAAVLLLAGVVTLMVLHLAAAFGARLLFGFNKTIVWKIGPAGMHAEAEGKSVMLPWNAVSGSKSSPAGVVVYPAIRVEGSSRQTYFWLPKTAFASKSDYSRFLGWLRADVKQPHDGASYRHSSSPLIPGSSAM